MAEKWTRDRRRELTRMALMDAAAEVFARKGFEGSSLEEIAEAAGFTRGAIYKNFEGKEALLLAVCDRMNRRALDAFAERLSSSNPGEPLEVTAMSELWRDVYATDPQFFALELEFRLYAARNPHARERFVEHRRATVQLVAQFVEEHASRAGVRLPVAPNLLAEVIIAASYGFTQAAYFDPLPPEVYEVFIGMLLPGAGRSRQ